MRRYIGGLMLCLLCFNGDAKTFKQFLSEFDKGYAALRIPEMGFDYKEYLQRIPGLSELNKQERFFKKETAELAAYEKTKLNANEQLFYEHLAYELAYNLQRIALEKDWLNNGKAIPANGLFAISSKNAWYQYFIKRYTSVDISPEQVYELGMSETKRVQREIERIQKQLGYTDKAAFYKHLQSDSFYLTDKNSIIAAYAEIDKHARAGLGKIVDVVQPATITAMEWPQSGPNTPPGMYLNKTDNTYGADVFLFTFYGGRHSKRCMEWLYMHEAIPGHHLQFTFRNALKNDAAFQHRFYYPGNFEGWACYIEYMGKDMGLYQDPYKELGKWEWDLVRSARLVLDVGIHYYGWSHDKALQFWRDNILGQDDIAEREITRVTNWPCQALSYKVGAYEIEMMKQEALKRRPALTLAEFHKAYLSLSYFPLQVVKEKMAQLFN